MSEASAKKSLAKAKGMELMTGTKRGTIRFIHGDSRFLPQFLSGKFKMVQVPVLKEGHTIMTMKESLECENKIRKKIFETGKWPKEEDYECNWESKWIVWDNEKEKVIQSTDTIITSSPFFSTIQERGYQGESKKNIAVDPEAHGHKGIATLYTDTENNIDNLKEYGADLITSSPPYGGIRNEGGQYQRKYSKEKMKLFRNYNDDDPTLSDPNQIGNLKAGSIADLEDAYNRAFKFKQAKEYVDCIIKSPPYGHGSYKTGEMTKWQKEHFDDWTHRSTMIKSAERYGDDKGNIGLLTGGVDTIAMSPPFSESHRKDTHKWLKGLKHGERDRIILSDNDDQIANLKYGADLITSSPPYGGIRNEGGQYQKKYSKEKMKLFRNYNDDDPTLSDPNQIGNLKAGEIDTIIQSPPYGHQSYKQKGSKVGKWQEEHAEDWGVIGHQLADAYGDDKGNIGLLTDGDIDTIIQSPPYGSIYSKNERGKSIEPRKEFEHLHDRKYSEDDRNIGNLKIDTIVQSPPFSPQRTGGNQGAGTYSGTDLSKGKNRVKDDYETVSDNNIGNLKRVDTVIQSPPYEHGGSVYSNLDPEKVKNNPNMKGRKAYFDEAAEPYSEDPNNIGQKRAESYIEAMIKVYQGCYHVLKNNGRMILVTKNFVKAGKEVRLDLDTIKMCESVGFKHIDTYYHKLNTLSFWQILLRKRCSNIKFRDPTNFGAGEKVYFVGQAKSETPEEYISRRDVSKIPTCKKYNCDLTCPFELGDQKMKCKNYINIYPKIEHEHVLVFKK